MIDGEAVLVGADGRSDFKGLHSRRHDDEVQFYAFDMLPATISESCRSACASRAAPRHHAGLIAGNDGAVKLKARNKALRWAIDSRPSPTHSSPTRLRASEQSPLFSTEPAMNGETRTRIIKHELSRSRCGSFPWDGRPSRYFYFENVPDRRLRPEHLTREEALEQAKALARAEQLRVIPGTTSLICISFSVD